MDWLQFISSVVNASAWPVAAVVIVLLFRRVLIALLPKLKTLKYGDVEATFGENLQQAEKDISKLPEPAKVNPDLAKAEHDVEKYSRNSAIFVAWLEVESVLLNLARSKGILKPNMSALQAARELYGQQIIDKQTYGAFRDLFDLRNAAVHPTDAQIVSEDELARFQRLAEKVSAVLINVV